jgi:hypothetical protein
MSDNESWVTIANEFTTVRVRKCRTRNGERLELFSPRLGKTIRLDSLELESLTWQDESTFSRLLETPFGPAGPTEARSLWDLVALDEAPRH